MQTLIQSKVKLKKVNCDNLTYEVKEKPNKIKNVFNFKFYQNLFVIIFMSCSFLIFPEAPKDSEVVCRKYHSTEACNIW